MIAEHDSEPSPGLPAPLPLGERVLWQGRPSVWGLAKTAFHVRAIAAYFALLAAWRAVELYRDGADLASALGGCALPLALAVMALGVLGVLAWLMARTTLYTVTSARVVMRFGVALTMSVNLPFSTIASADVKRRGDGGGDIALRPVAGERVSYLLFWPHVRPWRVAHPEPALRVLDDVDAIAGILAQALQASVTQPAAERPRRALTRAPASAPLAKAS